MTAAKGGRYTQTLHQEHAWHFTHSPENSYSTFYAEWIPSSPSPTHIAPALSVYHFVAHRALVTTVHALYMHCTCTVHACIIGTFMWYHIHTPFHCSTLYIPTWVYCAVQFVCSLKCVWGVLQTSMWCDVHAKQLTHLSYPEHFNCAATYVREIYWVCKLNCCI